MNLKGRFNRLLGKEPDAISPHEAWRRAVVRNGDLDWEGKPIDRNAGRPLAGRPERRGYFERVADFLERKGIRIERRNAHITTLSPDRIFDQGVETAELAHDRRFDSVNLGKEAIKQMKDFLSDGAVDGGSKRGGGDV
jgi:hypothetical protein